jgi:hypothetical protein
MPMKPPKRLFKRRERQPRWLRILVESSLEVGMIVEGEDFTVEKATFWFACIARSLARRMIEDGKGDPGTYEHRGKDVDGTDFLLCTVEIDDRRRVFVTYPNGLTIGFEREDLFNPEDN